MFKKIDDMQKLLATGKEQTMIIFKHSATCGLSAKAKTEVDAFMSETGRDVYLVVVPEERPISNALADALEVEHESPQLLMIDRGKVFVLNHRSIIKNKIISLIAP